MGRSHESLHIFGADLYTEKAFGRGEFDQETFEEKIQDCYGIQMGQEPCEVEYAGIYDHHSFADYKILSVFRSGESAIGEYEFSVGFVVNLNKEDTNEIERKKQILQQEINDFVQKTGFIVGNQSFTNLEFIL